MVKRIVVEFPLTMPSLANARMHWAQRARIVKNQRTLVGYSLAHRGVPKKLPWEHDIVVTIMRKAPRALDDDNLVCSAKAVRDAIATHFDIDDRNPRIAWRYAQGKSDSTGPSVRINFDLVGT